MSGETKLTVVGNIGGDVDLRFTPSGAAVANFSVCSTPRQYDKATNEWRDGEPMWLRCSAWRQMAENVAESLLSGMRVVVTGNLKSRTYETREGEKRTVFELDVEEVAPSLKYATAKVTKTSRENSSMGQGGGAPRGTTGDPWQAGPASGPAAGGDPWAAGGAQNQDPPF
jgi:single-strand DNA-binding protein